MLMCHFCTSEESIFKAENVIAGLAFLLSLIALRSQRKHNRNTLRPLAIVECRDSEDTIYVNIKNAGPGPLLFKSLKVFNAKNEVKDNLVDHMPKFPKNVKWGDFILSVESKALAPSETIALIHFSKSTFIVNNELSDTHIVFEDSDFAPFRTDIRKALAVIRIEITYEDIYGTSFITIQNLNYLFGRHFDAIQKT